MKSFLCSKCGKKHELLTSIEVIEPEVLTKIPEKEKRKRIHSDGFFYVLDNEVMLSKANLFLEVLDNPIKHFLFVVWCQWEVSDFLFMTKNLKASTRSLIGKISSRIPFYENAQNIPVKISFFLEERVEYPQVEILGNKSPLGYDYNSGISISKVKSWVESVKHSGKIST